MAAATSPAPSAPRVMVLNACFGDTLADSLLRMIDCVVGMHGAVRDDTAVAQAIATLATEKRPGEHLPIYRTRSGVSADELAR